MANIDLLTQETIETAHKRKPLVRRVPAHRFGDFAVHRGEAADLFREEWRITHLPTGRCVADEFRTFERAVDAMIEIARLRNDWAVIDDEGCTEELKQKVVDVVRKYGGHVGGRQDDLPRRPEFNGYRPEAS